MPLRYLLDEHVWTGYPAQIAVAEPEVHALCIGDRVAPPKGADDPQILLWCEQHDYVLVTNNRKSMPMHLAAHLAGGHHVAGILVIDPDMSIGETIEELILISIASRHDEHADRLVYLPLPGR